MRNLAAAVALALVGALGIAAPAAAAQTSMAKVVIVVGATHGTTPTYRSYADAAYAEAIKHTPNVTKIYSPNATWSRVKAAAYNANIVIYFGHGNGWPSPYTFDPSYTTKDGMGLNADLNGDGALSDYENKYYGEPYMAQLHLAPNAIVLLHNLCYASGNSEPGGSAPTVSVAHQRIDNYGAGFIKGGAAAVIADGHTEPGPYLAGLFGTSQSIVDLWRSMPDVHGHETSFASTRSPGFTDYSDPDATSSGFYRSLVTRPAQTTMAVTSSPGDTGLDPASLVVPGRASVQTAAAPLMATAAVTNPATPPLLALPAGTRLRTLATAVAATSTAPAVIQVQGLDDSSIAGYVSAANLAPRDSRAPVLVGIDTAGGRLSPNADGRFDQLTITAIFSEVVDWTLDVKNGSGTVVDTTTGHGSNVAVPWDGLANGVAVADGAYTWSIRGVDAWQNGAATGGGSLVVDTVGAALTSITPDGTSTSIFTPNGDASGDTVATTVTSPEAGSIVTWATNASGATVRTWTTSAVAGANVVTWDGRVTAGSVAPDGDYTLHFAALDRAGNLGAARARPVRLITLLGAVRSSQKIFYPQDGDRFAPTTVLSFALSRPATVTWVIRNAANLVVATHLAAAPLAAGSQTWTWNGTGDDGQILPRGSYRSFVSAIEGNVSITTSASVELNAFAIATSTATPRRGHSLSVVITSAEPLKGTPRIYVTEPGLSTWYVSMTKVNSRTWRASMTLRTGGSAGTLKLKAWGLDYDGRAQATGRLLPLG